VELLGGRRVTVFNKRASLDDVTALERSGVWRKDRVPLLIGVRCTSTGEQRERCCLLQARSGTVCQGNRSAESSEKPKRRKKRGEGLSLAHVSARYPLSSLRGMRVFEKYKSAESMFFFVGFH
jgi:hypothetical protein